MMPAAKHFDPVLGIDLHFINPPGPVTPVPHPFVGMVLDPFDYLPFIGATVMVNGVPRAQAGTGGVALPPHIPIGGVFVKPPDNECEMFMGSSTVSIDGDAATYLALPVLSCHDIGMLPPPRPKGKPSTRSMVLPTSMVLVVPTGPPVLIGGPPTISLIALGMRAAMTGLVKGLKSLRKLQESSRGWQRMSRRLQRKADDLLAGASDATRNRVRRALCTVTGHPVDVATGKVFTQSTDAALNGPLPFVWERVWFSTSAHRGALGHGWHHSFDLALKVDGEVTAVRLADGRVLGFPTPAEGQQVHHDREVYDLERTSGGWELTDRGERVWRFGAVVREDGTMPPTALRDLFSNRIDLYHDRRGRLVAIRDSVGREVVFDLDLEGRITALRAPDPDGGRHWVTLAEYEYDEHGDLVRAKAAEGSTFEYGYDDHLLVSETDPAGTTFHFQYEGSGVEARCVRTWGDGGLLERRLEYDPGVTTVSEGGSTSIYRCKDGMVVDVDPPPPPAPSVPRDPLGLWEGPWRPEGRSLVEPPPRPEGDRTAASAELDDRGLLTHFKGATGEVELRRDEKGEVVERRDDRGSTSYRCDGWGRRIWQMDPDGGETRWEYDRANRIVRRHDPTGAVHRFGWDARDNLVAHRGPGVDIRAISRVGLDWPGEIRLADGSSVELLYDGEGRLSAMVTETRESIRLERDAVGRTTEIRDTDGSIRRMGYDRSTLETRIGLPDERSLTIVRDETGQVVEVRGSDGLGQAFEYDEQGRLVGAVDGDERLEFQYEGDHLVRVESSDGPLEFRYDEDGRLVERVSPLGHQVRFGWAASGRIDRAGLPDGWDVTWARTADEVRIHFPNGVIQAARLDGEGRRIEESVLSGSGASLARRTMTYDRAGNLVEIRTLDGRIWRYGYDLRGRISLEVSPSGGERRFEWDAAGNLVAVSGGGEIRFAPGDRMVSMGDRVFRYDEAGRVVGRTRRSEPEETFEYDVLGRMVGWEDGRGRRVEYRYDALGRRRARVEDGATHRFIPLGEALLGEIPAGPTRGDGHGGLEYGILPRSLGCIFLLDGSETHFLHQDARAVVREVTDDRGGIRSRARYDPLGRFTIEGDLSLSLRLAGQVYDPETGLHYNHARMFDPDTGRFLTRDPMRVVGRGNAYSYAPSVLGWTDPSGRIIFQAKKVAGTVILVAGGILGNTVYDDAVDPSAKGAEDMRRHSQAQESGKGGGGGAPASGSPPWDRELEELEAEADELERSLEEKEQTRRHHEDLARGESEAARDARWKNYWRKSDALDAEQTRLREEYIRESNKPGTSEQDRQKLRQQHEEDLKRLDRRRPEPPDVAEAKRAKGISKSLADNAKEQKALRDRLEKNLKRQKALRALRAHILGDTNPKSPWSYDLIDTPRRLKGC